MYIIIIIIIKRNVKAFTFKKIINKLYWTKLHNTVGERGGEYGKQVGSMDEESQVRGCYNITFIDTNQETV